MFCSTQFHLIVRLFGFDLPRVVALRAQDGTIFCFSFLDVLSGSCTYPGLPCACTLQLDHKQEQKIVLHSGVTGCPNMYETNIQSWFWRSSWSSHLHLRKEDVCSHCRSSDRGSDLLNNLYSFVLQAILPRTCSQHCHCLADSI